MGVLRRALDRRTRTGRKATDAWLADALAELSTTTRTPCTLSYFQLDAQGRETADMTLVGLIPHLQREGHAVINVSGGGASPMAYVTVVPRHLSARPTS